MRLIQTKGRGLEAEVEVEGQRLVVVDALSPVEKALSPGEVGEAALEVIAIEAITRRIGEPVGKPLGFERDHGWRYRAIGEIVSTEPLVVDFGALRVELGFAPRDDWRPGERLAIAVDRIRLVGQGATG